MAHLTGTTYQRPLSKKMHVFPYALFLLGTIVALALAFYAHDILIPMFQARGGEVVAVEGGIDLVSASWKFSESTLFAEGEQVTVTLTNKDIVPHTFTIDELGVNLVVAPHSTQQVTFPAPAGTYKFYCAAPGHLAVGMEGTLTVGK